MEHLRAKNIFRNLMTKTFIEKTRPEKDESKKNTSNLLSNLWIKYVFRVLLEF